MSTTLRSPAVIVGVDGSPAAVSAARWAAAEAADRDIPLRLNAVVAPDRRADTAAVGLATAESALHECVRAVEAEQISVKTETEILQGEPVRTLLEAAQQATMLCIGAVGRGDAVGSKLGVGAAKLALAAPCPVAVIRAPADDASTGDKWIAAELDESPSSAEVLEFGMAEARLRGRTLCLISAWRPGFNEVQDTHAAAMTSRQNRAQLCRRLDWIRREHPDLSIKMVATQGNAMNFLRKHAASVDLVVVGHRLPGAVGDLVGSPTQTALHDTNFSVLVCPPGPTHRPSMMDLHGR